MATDTIELERPFAVLVGIDFSDAASYALAQAARVARRVQGSELHVVHVTDRAGDRAHAIEASTRLRAYTRGMAINLALADGQKLGVHVRVGNAAREIVQLATDIGADMVVLGSHKPAQLRSLFVGSVAERVVQSATCPVLVAGPAPAGDAAHEPAIEPACPRCVQERFATQGASWWCATHREHRVHAHVLSYHREWPLTEHDASVIPTGVD